MAPAIVPPDSCNELATSATVPAVAGNVISTSAVLAAPTRVTPFVPLSVPSSSLILPPTVVLVALITGALIVGAVIVLFVSVCDPVRVATVESMFSVTVWLPATEVKPVPPAIVRDCESKSTEPVPESPAMSKSSAVICVST